MGKMEEHQQDIDTIIALKINAPVMDEPAVSVQ